MQGTLNDFLQAEAEGCLILVQSPNFKDGNGSIYVHGATGFHLGTDLDKVGYFLTGKQDYAFTSGNRSWHRSQAENTSSIYLKDSIFVLGKPLEFMNFKDQLEMLNKNPRQIKVEELQRLFPDAKQIWPLPAEV